MAKEEQRYASTCDGVDSIEKQSEAKAKQAKVTICGAKEKQVKVWIGNGEAWRSDDREARALKSGVVLGRAWQWKG